MSLKIIKHQCAFLLKQRGAVFTFYVLLLLVLINFAGNVFAFQGMDVLEMVHPAKLLLLSFNRTYDNADYPLLFIQLYPVLVVCPAGFILLSEEHRKESLIILARIGSTNYYFGSMISAFCATAVVCSVPFLLELLLNCISFPLEATGDFWGASPYDPTYRDMTQSYLFSGLYSANIYLYTVVGILFFGVFSGVLGMFTAALSAIWKPPYKILLILPVYVLLNVSVYISEFVDLPFSVRWFDYVFLFNDSAKSGGTAAGFLLVLSVLSVGCIILKSKGDAL